MDLIDNIIATPLENKDYLSHVSCPVTAAHEKSIPVIHITIDFRRNYPEVPRMNSFWASSRRPRLSLDEIAVSRKLISAFGSSDLEALRGSMGIRNLVMAGVATNGVVLSTVRETMDKDHGITVLEDLCMDSDEEVHRVLNSKGFPVSGAVTK
ncbi:isochorismatase hydrolase [Colletotrichum tabaci]|uniref:Isochorismatase hydrolase n=1 Tax=Colletotrichum tabaci TaxID=1209068 RepID=A0AAV9T4A5_9PEZI